MKGVDEVIAKGYIDTRNLFVYGCSGGGVLTAWTVGHTDRFAAASSNCPVINWVSFAGATDINLGAYHRFNKLPWEDPTLLWQHSPLMYVGNVKTPTMLMTDELDMRTPISQTEEFYEALKLRKVPTADGALQRGVPRHLIEALELLAHAALPPLLVREVYEEIVWPEAPVLTSAGSRPLRSSMPRRACTLRVSN